MKKLFDLLYGVNPVVLLGAVMTPLVSILLAVVAAKLNFYTTNEQWDFVINAILASLISYAVAFTYIEWRTRKLWP